MVPSYFSPTSALLKSNLLLFGTLAFGSLTGHWLIPVVGFFVAGLTAFYMFRLVILTFFGAHVDTHRHEHLHESPAVMTIPLIVFAILSFFAFYSSNPINASDGWFAHAVERPESVVPQSVQAASTAVFEEAHHHAHMTAMVLSLLVAGIGILLAFATYQWKKINADAWAARFSGLYKFLLNKWYFDEFYGAVVVGGTDAVSNFLRWFDNTIVDGMVNGTASWTMAVVFGYTDHAKGKRFSAAAFLLVGTVVSLLVGYWIGQWFWMQGEIWTAVLMAVLCFGLTLYFFWAGAGGFDNRVVDGLVNGVGHFSNFFGILFQKLQTGRVQTYIAFVIFGVMVLFYMFR